MSRQNFINFQKILKNFQKKFAENFLKFPENNSGKSGDLWRFWRLMEVLATYGGFGDLWRFWRLMEWRLMERGGVGATYTCSSTLSSDSEIIFVGQGRK